MVTALMSMSVKLVDTRVWLMKLLTNLSGSDTALLQSAVKLLIQRWMVSRF